MDFAYLTVATKRADGEIIELWLREFRVSVEISVIVWAGSPLPAAGRRARRDAPYPQIDLDLFGQSMDRISGLKESEPKTDCIYHETKFVFLSCAAVSSASVVHTTVETSLQEAWAKTPNGKKRETTHIVRCQTEILRVKSC